jgi:hypothetical protein
MTPEIKKYLQELLHDAGQTGLGEEIENQMIEDLYSRLEDRLIITAMGHLSDAQQDELEGMGKDAAKTEAYLRKNIPDYDKVFSQVLVDFRNLYIEGSKA